MLSKTWASQLKGRAVRLLFFRRRVSTHCLMIDYSLDMKLKNFLLKVLTTKAGCVLLLKEAFDHHLANYRYTHTHRRLKCYVAKGLWVVGL